MQLMPFLPDLSQTLDGMKGKKRETVLTLLLLLDLQNLQLSKQGHALLREGKTRLDEDLVLALYAVGNLKAKLAIASSLVASHLSPPAFKVVFDPVYAREDLTLQQRQWLMISLEHFLAMHPEHALVYEAITLALAQSRYSALRVRGIPMAARFARFDHSLWILFNLRLRARSPDIRLTTLNAFRHLLDRLEELPVELRALVASDSLRKKVGQMLRWDPERYVRMGAFYLLRTYRERYGPQRRR